MSERDERESAVKAGEWIAEAIADVTQVLQEPVTVTGIAALTEEVRRCAVALEQVVALLAEALAEKGA